MPMSDQHNPPQWQRWQPENLLENALAEKEPLPVATPAHTDSGDESRLAQLSQQAEQQGFSHGMAQGEEEGRRQGYDSGYQSGYLAGLAQGEAEAKAAQQSLLQQAERWMAAFRLALDSLDSLIPARLVQLAMQVVQQLHGSHGSGVATESSALQAQIRQLMHQDSLLQGRLCLRIHPQDWLLIAPVLSGELAAIGWQVQQDEQLLPGGCRLLSEEGELDATLETRWQTLCQRLSEAVP